MRQMRDWQLLGWSVHSQVDCCWVMVMGSAGILRQVVPAGPAVVAPLAGQSQHTPAAQAAAWGWKGVGVATLPPPRAQPLPCLLLPLQGRQRCQPTVEPAPPHAAPAFQPAGPFQLQVPPWAAAAAQRRAERAEVSTSRDSRLLRKPPASLKSEGTLMRPLSWRSYTGMNLRRSSPV